MARPPRPKHRGRLTRSVVDPAAVFLPAEPRKGRSLAVTVRQKKKKEKETKKKVLRDAPNHGFRNPSFSQAKSRFSAKNGHFLTRLRGGSRGSAAEAGFEPGGVKNTKNWGKTSLFARSDWEFPIKTAFFRLRALRAGPSNFFCPTWFSDFRARGLQKRVLQNDRCKKGAWSQQARILQNACFPAGFFGEAWVSRGQNHEKLRKKYIF